MLHPLRCLVLAAFTAALSAAQVVTPSAQALANAATAPEVDQIFQFFVASTAPKSSANSGAYLWIPPKTTAIRAVMVGIHNGLPLTILQSAPVRAVCRTYGIAQILLTPNGSDIGPVMLKNLSYDITDPERTAVYDHYLQALAEVSGHPELTKAPIVPLAHSAYMSFPFEAAMRHPEQCLAAIPIKAGTPDCYAMYAKDGKAKAPNPDLCLRNVPLIIIDSAAQETVPGRWKTQAYPQPFEPNFIGNYRRDRQDNPGTGYEPRNELIGGCWDMISGHFDMLPRNYAFVAAWLETVAQTRLPATAGAPLKNLVLRDGWLMDPKVPKTGPIPPEYAQPAKYLEFKGNRSKALWFPSEALARGLYEHQRDEMRKEVEVFTVRDAKGQPVSLAESPMANMPDPNALLNAQGQLVLETWHYPEPPQICSVQDKGHGKNPDDKHVLGNPLFPGKSTLALSKLPLQFDANGGLIALVRQEEFSDSRGLTETRFVLRLTRTRLAPEAGFQMFFPRIFHESDERFTAAGRTVQFSWSLTMAKGAKDQKVTFPAPADAPATTAKIPLGATSSAGLPVDYFVAKGPGIIQDGAFVPAEIPAGATKPIEVTIGAYQAGSFTPDGGVKPSNAVYQTFHLKP